MIKAIQNFLDTYGIDQGGTFVFIGILLIAIAFVVVDVSVGRMLGFAIATSPLWLPFVLFFAFYSNWMTFVRTQSAFQERVTLEIMLPQEVTKSPEAMELVLGQLYQKASPDNVVDSYWDGKHPLTTSLEIVSHGGTVHFYMNVPKRKFKNIAEAQMYAQYPGIEIRELPVDYTAEIPAKSDDWEMFAVHMGVKRNQAIPIKTYYDYRLEMNPKEEEKVDPITVMIDAIAAIGPHERAWMQILISAHKSYGFKEGALFAQPDWKEGVKDEIKKVLAECKERSVSDDGTGMMTQMTDGERRKITAMERSLSKFPFDTRIRIIYAAKKEHAQIGERIGSLIQTWYQHNDMMLNEFGVRWRTDFDYNWWQDRSGRRRRSYKEQELEMYKMRAYENHSQFDKSFVMTTEEIATMWHLPGQVALTPTLGRIPSTRGEAPPNLPV